MQLQVKLKELQLQKMTSSPSESPPITITSFDVSRQVRLVSQFYEEEVDKFFLHFEKLATTLAIGIMHNVTAVCTCGQSM